MSECLAVLGMQWGDEGKGKIVDLISPRFDAVVRFQGGNNAGHTVEFEDEHFALHFIPSGVLQGALCLLGNGVVIDPDAFFDEITGLHKANIDTTNRVFISDRAHIIMPLGRALDRARELSRGKNKIGTTAKGIGPTYETKMARLGIRMCDLNSSGLEKQLSRLVEHANAELSHQSAEVIDFRETLSMCREWSERLVLYLKEGTYLIEEWRNNGMSILFEGAQGTMLDIDHGTYPYVTSSNTTVGGMFTGSGLAPSCLDRVIGVLKAYTTRVGEGPFPTELHDEIGESLRSVGKEFGTTTGRPRRCGWLDIVVARYSCLINGIESIALTKLDVLDEVDSIKICVGYTIDGVRSDRVPASLERLACARPVYKSVSGWNCSTVGITRFEELPKHARHYIEYVERLLEKPIEIISTGPRREETIVRW